MDNQKTKKIILASVFIVVVVVAIILVVILNPNNGTTDNGKPVKTEIGTDAEGNWIVTQGTNPDGVVIENGTYPDGTRVGVAIGENGEPATQSDGSYVINYPVYDQSSDNDNKSDNDNGQSSTSKSDSNSKTSSSSSSKPKDSSSSSKASSSSASSSSASSSKPSSSNPSSSSTSKPSSSSQASKPTSKPSTSSTPTPSSNTPQGDSEQKSTIIIDGTKYQIGDKIKVSYYLTLPIKFTGINASVNYDSKVLGIVEETTEMPNLSNAMNNDQLNNEMRFTAVSARAVNDFSNEKLLVSCVFEIKNNSTTSSEINLNIVELLDDDVQNISGDNYSIRAEVSKV